MGIAMKERWVMSMSKCRFGLLAALVLLNCAGCFTKQVRTPVASEKLEEFLHEVRVTTPQNPHPLNSLWNDGAAYLVTDFKARMPGDIVTVIISESTDAISTATADNSRTSQINTTIPQMGGLEKRIKELPNALSGQGASTFAGKGTTTRQSTLNATVTARVREVLPNGNLVIEGYRDVRIHNENQSLSLSGIVRPRDVSPNNEVASGAVAFMEVKLQGKGLVTDNLKPGWLFRLLRGISPF
jgi:flagellar L-ring protein precursor FlgH